MAEVKTWTVEQIEAAACTASDHEYKPFSWRHDLCETCGCSKDRHEWGAMIRAFAAQTRQVELALAVKPSTVLIAESPEWWTEDRMRILDYGKSTAIHAMQLVLRGGAFTKAGAQ